jgi:hypothetical protein
MKRTAPLALAILLSLASASAMAGDRHDRRHLFEPDRRAGGVHDWRDRQIHDWRDHQERRDGDERRDWHERFGRYEFEDRRRVVLRPGYESDRRHDGRGGYRHPDHWR